MHNIDYQQKTQEIVGWMQKIVHKAGCQRLVVAVSGGVDSAVALNLAVQAMGKNNVYALLMPYGTLSTKALLDGKAVARASGLAKDHSIVRDIKKVTDKIWSVIPKSIEDLPGNEKMAHVRFGNIMARVRMIFLYDLAKQRNALVVGTENKSEHYLGYFTRFGDEASDIEPIRGLYKTQVWEMARYLDIPQEIIEKAPSANLWEGQSDEGEFGFSYADADTVLYHYFEERLPKEGIVALGIPQKVVERVLRYVEKNDFKHHVPFVLEDR